MAVDPLDSLRLTLMQELLPMGVAVVERARRGGPAEVMAAFEAGSGDVISRLRQEGEPLARQLRDGLDRVQPGLGNPVVRVQVRDVPEPPPAAAPPRSSAAAAADPQDPAELQQVLLRIAEGLALLESQLALADDATPASPPVP